METEYTTRGGVRVRCDVEPLPYPHDLSPLAAALDARRGLLLASSCDVPGRYARYDLGFVDPPLAFAVRGRTLEVDALSERGAVLLPAVAEALGAERALERLDAAADRVRATVRPPSGSFTEEERTRQPSVFSLLRAVLAYFASDADPHLGLYGAFGYDLVFAFEPLPLRLPRAADQRDLVLYLPDEIAVVDHRRECAERRRYDFTVG
ncbi:MAG TPA: anthranilate synthase component I, partial [Myxococcota bacterium]|nr:anthranilate synthase component I [Myxococcota bacterium]